MRIKLMVFYLVLCFTTKAQDESFITNGKFTFVDTLSKPENYTVNPGQLTKNGNKYLLGMYYDGDDDTAYSKIFSIDILSKSHSPLEITGITDYKEFFQCSASDNEEVLVMVGNNFKGWAGNDLVLAERKKDGTYAARALNEVNSKDTVDAYPWLSGDGLRIYYIKDEVIYFSDRSNLSEKFKSPSPLVFTNPVQTSVRSIWLNKSEKKLFYISNNIIYVAERKKNTQPFKLPSVFTKEFSDLEFIASLSFTPDMKHLYLYYSGDSEKILHYKLK